MSMQFSARSSIRFETLATENWRHRDNAFSVSPCLCVPIGANGVRGEARGMLSLHLPGPLHIISVFWQPERGGYHEEDIPAQQQPLSPFRPTTFQNQPAPFGRHARAKSVGLFSPAVVGLECPLHGSHLAPVARKQK